MNVLIGESAHSVSTGENMVNIIGTSTQKELNVFPQICLSMID